MCATSHTVIRPRFLFSPHKYSRYHLQCGRSENDLGQSSMWWCPIKNQTPWLTTITLAATGKTCQRGCKWYTTSCVFECKISLWFPAVASVPDRWWYQDIPSNKVEWSRKEQSLLVLFSLFVACCHTGYRIEHVPVIAARFRRSQQPYWTRHPTKQNYSSYKILRFLTCRPFACQPGCE